MMATTFIKHLLTFLASTFLLIHFSASTFDVSSGELQEIASQLSNAECRKLYATLHFRHMNLDRFSGKKVPNLPCLDLLNKWNDQESDHRSFQLLDLRLTQLGHKDLADTISSQIFDRQSRALRNAFKDSGSAKNSA